MARKPRVHFPAALYHVIARGNQKQAIFLDERDFRTYLSYLSEYKKRHSFRLYAYALMVRFPFVLILFYFFKRAMASRRKDFP